jgi:hypothetical protein
LEYHYAEIPVVPGEQYEYALGNGSSIMKATRRLMVPGGFEIFKIISIYPTDAYATVVLSKSLS